jgi:hypothetical protein
MSRLPAVVALSLAFLLPAVAAAQPLEVTPVPAQTPAEPPPLITVTPVDTPPATPPPVATPPVEPPPTVVAPAEPPPPAVEPEEPPPPFDPGRGQLAIVPTARPLREGDVLAQYIGYSGLFGVQFGIDGNADIGVGIIPIQLALNIEAKVAFVNSEHVALSAFGGFMIPLYRDEWPLSAGGLTYFFTFAFGPLLSLYNDKAELDVGLVFAPTFQWQADGRYDTDYGLFPWLMGSVRLGDSFRMMLGVVHFGILGLEARGDINVPAALLGVRWHNETWAVDFGLGFPLHPDWWDLGSWAVTLPFLTIAQMW